MSVDLSGGETPLDAATPTFLFEMKMRVDGPPPYDVASDRSRFLVNASGGVEAITVVLNGLDELRERISVN